MIRYEFKTPNLLEVLILLTIIVISYWFISYQSTVNNIITSAVGNEVTTYLKIIINNQLSQTILLWFILLTTLFNSLILEGIRDKL